MVKTFSQNLADTLLARPNVKSLSCIMIGIFFFLHAKTTGSETYPPFENTTSGLMSFNIFSASFIPFASLIGIRVFFNIFFLINYY